MCGLAGFHCFDGDRAELRRRVPDTLAALRRRGPDGAATWFSSDGATGFAHTRLAILDLSDAAAQPMATRSGRVVIAFNGEIYNFGELRTRLAAEGLQPRTSGDTEVVAETIERLGIEALRSLRGMFALAWHDERDGAVHLARDRFGIKPLVYAVHHGAVVFGSTIGALRALRPAPWTIDESARFEMLAAKCVSAPRTIFREARQVRPGHVVRIDRSGGITETEFATPFDDADAADVPSSAHDLDGRLERLLAESVRDQLVADVPVGVFLSGGVDSSLVAAFAQESLGGGARVRTIGVSFPGHAEIDEGPAGSAVAAALGTNHVVLTCTAADIAEEIDGLWEACDEPFGDAAILPTMAMSRAARKVVTVALSGDGGDETALGYDRYRRWGPMLRPSTSAPRWLRRAMRPRPAAIPTGAVSHVRAALFLGDDPEMAPLQACLGPYAQVAAALTGLPAETLLDSGIADASRRAGRRRPGDPLRAMADMDVLWYLPADAHFKVDRASMHSSLEVRVPLLDEGLVAELARTPTPLLTSRRVGKLPYRRLLRRRIGALADAKKRGFAVPIADWVFNDWRDRTETNFDPRHVEACGLRPDALNALVAEGRRDGWSEWVYALWPVWAYLDWSRRVQGQSRAP